jgi:hypothetical protein
MARKRLLAGVEAVAAGSVRSLQLCSSVRHGERVESTQLAYRSEVGQGKSWIVEAVVNAVLQAAVAARER